jgi:regulatory protein YycI of two-component signal transduction system YycFG
MFAALKSMPKLLGAKVEIMFLYYDHNDDDNETVSYDQAVIERINQT